MGWLKINETGVSVLDILEMLAENKSPDDIVRRYPLLSFGDIASAAATARYLILYHWAVCRCPESALSPDRRITDRTKPIGKWTPRDDLELTILFRSGASVENMARIFVTGKTDITERLKRLNLM